MTRNYKTIVLSSMLAVGVLFLSSLPLAAQETTIRQAQGFAISAPLGELAEVAQPPQYGFHEANPVRRVPKPIAGRVVDPVEQNVASPESSYTLGANILGIGNGFPQLQRSRRSSRYQHGGWRHTDRAMGEHILYGLRQTSPYKCSASVEGNQLWSKLGGICAANNDGDIIAQWDLAAHRWLLSQNVFAGSYGVCVAVSTTADATGTYFLYEFPVLSGGFPDYPKWGVWPTGYFETWNNFGPGGSGFVGPVLCAYHSAKLLAGDKTAEQICHQYPNTAPNYEDSLIPADRDSVTAPPTGQDEFAIGSVGDIDNSHLSLYSVHIKNESDWTKGATFTGDNDTQLIAIAPFTPSCGGSNYGGACVPQKGITDLADSLGDRLMYRFAYSNDKATDGSTAQPASQHWLVNLDVQASGGQIGVRWMEITAPLRRLHQPL